MHKPCTDTGAVRLGRVSRYLQDGINEFPECGGLLLTVIVEPDRPLLAGIVHRDFILEHIGADGIRRGIDAEREEIEVPHPLLHLLRDG
jgi:hypothetical protein